MLKLTGSVNKAWAKAKILNNNTISDFIISTKPFTFYRQDETHTEKLGLHAME